MSDYKIFDPENMARSIFDFPENIHDALKIGDAINVEPSKNEIRNIVVAGMGGSAIGGDVVRVLVGAELTVPLIVSRHYELPAWVNKNTLVICSSYSGNTEETLAAFEDAKNKGAFIVGITTGGKLLSKLKKENLSCAVIPSGLQPRAAMAFSFIPMLFLLKKLNLISNTVLSDLRNVMTMLRDKREGYSLQHENNPTLKLAEKIANKIPVIYGQTTTTGIAAMRWKGQICENAKMLAYRNELPELNHNEIVGWENNPEALKHIALIWLKDTSDNPRVKHRQNITQNILKKVVPIQESVTVHGKTMTERFLHLIYFGDWVSYWCAVIHGTDPSPVFKIENLKKELGKL